MIIFVSFYSPKNSEKCTQILMMIIIIRINISRTANQNIMMISDGSRDCSNDAENSAEITRINVILKFIQIENSYFKQYKYFTMLLLYFGSNKCRPVEQKKHKTSHCLKMLLAYIFSCSNVFCSPSLTCRDDCK